MGGIKCHRFFLKEREKDTSVFAVGYNSVRRQAQ